jgi:lipopolysaccharide transport system ATP-binding protein
MTQPAIRCNSISKKYRIGERERSLSLREALASAAGAPFRRIGRIFGGNDGQPSNREATIWALKDVSFEIQRGEVVGIIGRNGAGKSTLLKILSRITEPTLGRVEIRGSVGSLLEVGTGFHPELTGRENVFLNGAILGMRKQEIARKFDEIVAFAEVEKFIDTPVKRYSSGMYVRLAFAVAAHLDTEILLVDEVLAVGDVGFQRKCFGKIGDVSRGGRTIILVSHNMNAVSTLCQAAMLLEEGRLTFHSSDVHEALRYYSSPVISAHTVDLSIQPRDRGDRFFEEISLVDEERGPSHSVPPGANLAIRLRVNSPRPILTPRISLALTSCEGHRVLAIGTNIGGNVIPLIEGRSTICARFIVPPLVPGEYTLDVGMYDRTGLPLDEIHGAAHLDVLNDGYLQMVEEHNRYMGHIMVRSEWTCTQDDVAASVNSAPVPGGNS